MLESKSLAKNAIFNIVYRVLNILFPLISATYVSRVLLPSGVGQVAYAQNIVSYFTMFAALGIPTYGVREISKYRENQEKTNRVFSELLIINACSTTLCLLGYGLLVLQCFNTDYKLYLVCGLLIVFNFINIDWFYQGKEDYVYIAVRSVLIKLISIIALLLFVKNRSDYIIYALLTCMATGGNYLFNIIHSRKYVSFTLRGLEFRRHFKPILYLVICVIAAELYSKVDITMLGSACTEEVVGYYNNAQKLIALVLTLTTAISAIFLPRISYYFAHDKEKYNESISLGFKIVSFFAIPACIGIFLVADNLTIVMFGETFLPAASTIRILVLLILIKSFGDLLCYQVIISSGNEKKLLKSYILAAIANIVLNSLLIPHLAQNGAAIASVVSEFLLNVILFIFVSLKIIKLNVGKKYISSVIVGTLGMGIVVNILAGVITNPFFALAIQVVVGVGIYLLINLIMKNEMVFWTINKLRRK